jgi:hypothetical protein
MSNNVPVGFPSRRPGRSFARRRKIRQLGTPRGACISPLIVVVIDPGSVLQLCGKRSRLAGKTQCGKKRPLVLSDTKAQL